jgi:hypothetical protein
VQPTGMTLSHGNDALGKQVCNVAMNIYMDNTPPFQATCHQGVPILALQALMTPGTVVAVRVNPQNPQEVAIDFDTDPPTVTMSATGPNRGSAAELLATGTPGHLTGAPRSIVTSTTHPQHARERREREHSAYPWDGDRFFCSSWQRLLWGWSTESC